MHNIHFRLVLSHYSMRVSLTCLSTGFKDNDGEFVLECENSKWVKKPIPMCRYLINARDGTQRLCNEFSIRLSKLKGIFITRMSPETLGGLPGFVSVLLVICRYASNDLWYGIERIEDLWSWRVICLYGYITTIYQSVLFIVCESHSVLTTLLR